MKPELIEDLEDPRLDPYLRLTNHQLRCELEPERALLICESQIAIEVALKEGVRQLSLLADESQVGSISSLLAAWPDDVPVLLLPHNMSEKVTGYRLNRGILAAMKRPQLPSAEGLLERLCAEKERVRLAVLEGLVDVSNVGALFRSAAALDVDGVIVAPDCADPWNRRSVRVSMGTIFQVPWAKAEGRWPGDFFGLLERKSFTSVALALTDDAVPLSDPALKEPLHEALFFGSEGYGLSEAVLSRCDRHAIIPMSHGVDSLNVAASSAVTFWELCARR